MLQGVPIFKKRQNSGPHLIGTPTSLLLFSAILFSNNHSGIQVCVSSPGSASLPLHTLSSFCKMGLIFVPTSQLFLEI